MLKRSRSKPTVGDNEAFVTLVSAVREDPELRRTLSTVLRLPAFHRQSLLNSMIQDMVLGSEDADLIAAVSALLDDGVAATVAELIKDP